MGIFERFLESTKEEIEHKICILSEQPYLTDRNFSLYSKYCIWGGGQAWDYVSLARLGLE